MPDSPILPASPALSDGLLCLDASGYLTSSLEDARRVRDSLGGLLFPMGRLYLVGGYAEALQWGWRPEKKRQRLTGRDRALRIR